MYIGTIGEKLRKLRKEKKLSLRKVATMVNIDVAILSKMERGERRLSKKMMQKLAKIYKCDEEELMVHYLSEKVMKEIGDEDLAIKALHVAEEQIAYIAYKKINLEAIRNPIIDYFKKDGRISKVWIFGSLARGEDDYKSDIDMMIEVPENIPFSLFDLAEIQYQLEKLVTKKIDIVMKDGVKPHIMERIKPDLRIIYAR
jgi:predicted nucleotidyltransferase